MCLSLIKIPEFDLSLMKRRGELIPRGRVLLEKLTVTQQSRNSPP
jgi:hypothetical protein